VQHRTAAKEASCRKYKEAVRAFKVCARPLCVQSYACLPAMQQQQHHFHLLLFNAIMPFDYFPSNCLFLRVQLKLAERDDALAQRQAHIKELHGELCMLQRLLQHGPLRHATNPQLRASWSPAPTRPTCATCSSACGHGGTLLGGGPGGGSAADVFAAASDGATTKGWQQLLLQQ
jgi:hypothetical protein